MSLIAGGDGIPLSQPAIRGHQTRYTDLMEQLQVSYLKAVASSAGCIVASYDIDDGVDAMLTHKSDHHVHLTDRTARLEVQLKATTRKVTKTGFISITMDHERWEFYRTKDPSMNKIVVIMSMPSDQAEWTLATHDSLAIRHCGYWVNIAGADDTNAAHPTIRAETSQIFNDIALCGIMERIGQGGVP